MDSTITARVGLNDSGFQQGVSRIQRSLRLVRSEFAVASSGIGGFKNSTEQLTLRTNTLNRQIQLQRDRISALTRSYQEQVRINGESSRAAENLRIRLNNATAELNNMQNELEETTRELGRVSSRWNMLSETMTKAGTKMKAVGDKMSSIGRNLSTAVTLPILGIGTAATKMAMDAIESENLFEVAMGKMAGEARKWSENISKSLGLNAYNVRRNVATFNAMLTSMGLTAKESLKMSESLTQLSYDMASFYNLKPEEAFLKIRAGISGETEPLKALGILVNENTIKAYAYANGIAKQGAVLTEVQKVQARYGVILKSTQNAQGDLGRTLDSPTNKLRVMKEQVEKIGIQFGQILIPILEKLINIIKPLLDNFQGLSKEQQELVVKIALVAASMGPLLFIAGKVISMVGTLTTVIGTMSGAVASAGGISAALGSVFAAITGPVGIAIAAITAVVAAITGFIAALVLLYKNNEEFRNNVNSVLKQIKDSIVQVIESIKVLVSVFVEEFKEFWNKYGEDIVNILSTAFKLAGSVVTNALNSLKNVIKIITSLIKGDWKGAWEGVKILAKEQWDGIKKIIKIALDLIVKLISFGMKASRDITKNMWEAIKLITKSVWNKTLNFVKAILGKIRGIFTNIFNGIKNFISNIWNSIYNKTVSVWNKIKNAITKPVSGAVNFVKNQINRIKGFFASLKISLPKIKLPHFNLKGSFSLNPPSVPTISVNWYASGGIFQRPSIIGVGEKGAEAVIPLERLDEMITKAIIKAKGEDNGLKIIIEKFINNTEKDIEQLAYELEFYRRRTSIGRGYL